MKKYIFFILVFWSIKCSAIVGVTYQFSGGRLGDNIISYLHAKWFAYKYKFPLLYIPFDYASDLMLSQIEKRPLPKNINKIKNKIVLDSVNCVREINSIKRMLYVIPYFSEFQYENVGKNRPFFHVDWDDPPFKALVRQIIKPIKEIRAVSIPKNKISIAVHVRCSDNHADNTLTRPLKMPPSSYYIEQIRFLSHSFNNRPLFVHIFTDSKQPDLIVEEYTKALELSNIEFGFRSTQSADQCVLDDLFSMINFDCLIMCNSNYSFIASKLKDFLIVISPLSAKIQNGIVTIDRVNIVRGY